MMYDTVVLEKQMESKERRNLVLFTMGKLVSLLGSSIYTFAIGLYVLTVTGSAGSFATTLVFGMIPMLLINPFAGVLADRLDKKKLVVGADAISGLSLVGLYLFTSERPLTLTLVYGSVFLLALLNTFFGIALEASKPQIVAKDRLLSLNASSKVVDSLSTIGGPMLGGLIYALVDIRFFLLCNGISFLLSALSEGFIDFHLYQTREKMTGPIGFRREIREAFDYLRAHADMQFVMWIFLAINFILGFAVMVPLPYIVNEVFRLESTAYGIIQSASSVGLILGALVVGRITKHMSYSRLLLMVNTLLGVCILAMALPLGWAVPMDLTVYLTLVMGLLGVAISLLDIPIMAIMQTRVPEAMLGRVMSLVMTLVKIIAPLGLLLSGWAIQYIPTFWMLTLSGMVMVALTLLYRKLMTRIDMTL